MKKIHIYARIKNHKRILFSTICGKMDIDKKIFLVYNNRETQSRARL